MRILFLVNHEVTLYYFRTELLEALVREGHEVFLSMPKAEHAGFFEKLGCRILDTPITQYGMNPIREMKLIKEYNEMIRENFPDIILTYTIKPALYGGIAAASTGIPYISTITGLGAAFEKGKLFSLVISFWYRFSTRKISCMFFQNKEHSKKFDQLKIAVGKHRIVPGSGVNLEKHSFEQYPQESGTHLLFIGRMMRDKGIFELCEAVENLAQKYDITLDIIGWCEDECKELKESFKKDGAIHYLGWQEDVRPFVRRSHAVVLPSYHEGMANGLLEAQAGGRPVLASNIPGCIETFDEGVTGFGFEVRNEESLENAIEKFCLLSNAQRAEMGAAARKKVEKEFDRKTVVNEYLNAIHEFWSMRE